MKSLKTFFLASLMMLFATACGDNGIVPDNKPDDATDETLHKDHEDPAKIELIFAVGHFHGDFEFHQNPVVKGVKYMTTIQKFVYKEVKGKGFTLTDDSPKKLVAAASEPSDPNVKFGRSVAAYGLWIRYYNAKDELINQEFVTNGQDRLHQHFFIPKNVVPNDFGKVEDDDNDPSKIYEYTYCDSDPWDGSLMEGTAKYIGDVNPIGMKGYFYFVKPHKKFDMEIRLMHASGSKYLEDGSTSPYYKPNSIQLTRDHWDMIVRLPVEVLYLQKYNGLSTDYDIIDPDTFDFNEFSEREQQTLLETAAAFGVDWREILRDFKTRAKSSADPESGSMSF